jgi:hypothetical protein
MQTLTFGQLPLAARCALEYFGCQDAGNRTADNLNKYLDHYGATNGQVIDDELRTACHRIATARYWL